MFDEISMPLDDYQPPTYEPDLDLIVVDATRMLRRFVSLTATSVAVSDSEYKEIAPAHLSLVRSLLGNDLLAQRQALLTDVHSVRANGQG